MQRVILHCDMNNFYASVECIPYCFPTVSKLYEAVRIQLGYYIPEQAEKKRQGKCRKDGEEGDG